MFRRVTRSTTTWGIGLVLLALIVAPAAAQDLPSADSLIEKFVEASGGEETIRSAGSMHSTGVMEIPSAGMNGNLEIWAKAPNRMLMTMELPNVGTVKTGFDGDVGWIDNPMTGAMLIEGEQLKELLRQADFYSALNYEQNYPTRETVEQTEFAGQPAYKVRLVDADGKELIEYFAVDSGLKLGFEGEQTNEMGMVYVTTELGDYQEVGGQMVPKTTTIETMGMEMTMKLDAIELDEIDDSVFALPENIKSLAEQAAKAVEGAEG